MSFLRLSVHTVAISLLITLATVVLFSLFLIKPFSEQLAWSIACYVAEKFWNYMQYHWETTLNAAPAIEITGDELPAGENALVLSNHLGYSDYYLIHHLAAKAGMLGKCRYFAKRELAWQIPIFGPAFWAIGFILVSRNWTEDESKIESAFRRIKGNKLASWIILYPEGTRRSYKKVLESKAFARTENKPELDHVLYPRTKGFVSTVRALQNSHIQYVYDLTLLYTSPGKDRFHVPSLSEQLSCDDLYKAGYRFRIHVKRTALSKLPRDEAGLRKWCEAAWVEKDNMLDMICPNI